MDYLSNDFLIDILSDTSSTGYSDKYPMFIISANDELQLSDNDLPLDQLSDLPDDYSLTYICEICHKNIIKLQDSSSNLRKKRKRCENQLITASMKVCDECRKLNLEDLKKLSGPVSCKRVIKREHAKRRAQEIDNLKNIKEQQEKQIDENQELTECEKKKMKQVIRNRISAQQSRDRKKVYIHEIEKENEELKQQTFSLNRKIQLLNQENQYLKNQLAQIHFGGNPGLGTFKAATLGIATLLSVFVVLNSMSDASAPQSIRQLSTQLDLSVYKNQEGVSLQQISDQILTEAENNNLLVPLNGENSIVKYRKQRVEAFMSSQFLKPIDPCESKMEGKALATVVCPSVQTYWDSEQSELRHIQLILPLESMPAIENTVADTSGQKHMIEILCAVNEINILPISANGI